jgi:hypothetical protein
MRQLEFTAKIAEDELKRLRQQKRTSSLSVGAVVLLAIAWISSGLDLAPTPTDFGTLQVGKGSKLQRVTLTNRNVTDFLPSRIVLQGASAGDFQLDSKACAKVEAGESCNMFVEFRPRHPGIVLAKLIIYGSEGEEITSEFTGVATGLEVNLGLTFTPTRANFGTIEVGASTRQGIRLTNPNDTGVPLRIGLDKDSQGEFLLLDAATCSTVPARSSCTLQVEFHPQAPGVKAGDLVAQLSDGTLVRASLNGAATPQNAPPLQVARIRIEPESMDFSRPNPARQTLTILNGGTAASRIGFRLAGKNAERFTYDASACGSTVAPNSGECKVVVSYNSRVPASREPLSAQLQISHDDPGARTPLPVELRWNEPTPQVARIHIEPQAMDFARPNRAQQTLTILNSGTTASKLSFHLTGANADRFTFDASACGESVAPSTAGCNVTVSYKSKFFAKRQPLVAQLEVSHEDPETRSPLPVQLRWSELPPPPQPTITMTPNPVTFAANRSGGSAAPQTVTIKNEGPGTLSNWTLRLGQFGGGENKEFSHDPACCKSLEPGQACTGQVSFKSAKPGK